MANFMKIREVGSALMRADGQKNTMKLIGDFFLRVCERG